MGNERLPGETQPEQNGIEGQKNPADDLRFMRSALEKTFYQIKPNTRTAIIWGLIAMTSYIGIHFLLKFNLYTWIKPFYLSLLTIGFIELLIEGHLFLKQLRREGFIPKFISKILCGFSLVFLPIIIFDQIGLFNGMYCNAAFIYAIAIGIYCVIVGLLHYKTWFLVTIIIYLGVLMAFYIKDYTYIILGIATGAGIIIPALIVDWQYRKQENNHE
jgi:hypothetical protein